MEEQTCKNKRTDNNSTVKGTADIKLITQTPSATDVAALKAVLESAGYMLDCNIRCMPSDI